MIQHAGSVLFEEIRLTVPPNDVRSAATAVAVPGGAVRSFAGRSSIQAYFDNKDT